MPGDPQLSFIEQLASRRPPWFWWLLALILACCFSILSWSLCISIFNNPQLPRNYEILRKLNRLPVHKAYTFQTAPKHPTSSAATLRKSYLEFNGGELDIVNRSLMHSYLTNFREAVFCTYLVGTYKVTRTRELNKDDVISQGFAVQLRSMIQPDEYSQLTQYPLIAEIIFPTSYSNSHKGFHAGDILDLSITPHFASLLHIEKHEQDDDDTIVVLTAVSLASTLRSPHEGPFDLLPPREVKLDASYPLFPNNE
ncbi:MAG: hypothetical protein HN759_05470 [Akkermansiaceae bacterium]|nr:hypothetical protein [Akkermansiaceae bacterium]